MIQREVAVSNAAHPSALVGRRSVSWLAFLILLVLPGLLRGATFTVTNTNNSGPGSLRQAILNANGSPGMDTINFSIGFGPQTIAPTSPLPTITDPVIIDATTQPGYSGPPIIELNGSNAGAGANGLYITAGNSTVTGLVINRFRPLFLVGGGNGILLENGGGNGISGNYIGTNMAGTSALGNGGSGILISNSAGNAVAFLGVGPGRSNLISGNATGIQITGTASNANLIDGNWIGTDVTGTIALRNSGDGVAVSGGTGNRIGHAGTLSGVGNLISGNNGAGVLITASATGTVVWNNLIGTNAAGMAALANTSNGVLVNNSAGNMVGGTASALRNVISGNGANGVLLINSGTTGNLVQNNFVGTDRMGTATVGNALNGVIVSAANNNTIGGTVAGARNVISGNGTNGVRIRSGASGNVVQGNFIGTDRLGTAPLGNTLEGVQINDGASSNTIGGASPGERNVISGNRSNGVLITDTGTTNNTVSGNFIGTEATGTLPLGNSNRGVSIEGDASSEMIGGTVAGAGNNIAFNGGEGVWVGAGTGHAIRRNSIFSNSRLGIDLAPVGVTPNDPCDTDTGPNNLQNFPVLTAASSSSGSTTIEGTFNSTPNSTLTLEFFANIACDPSGFGQGRASIGSTVVTTDGSCNADINVTLPTTVPVHFVTATATDSSNNTSEFSRCLPVSAAFYTLAPPCRIVDTRGPDGPFGGPPLGANTDRRFAIAGQYGIPSTAKAVSVTVIVAQPAAGGHLALYAGGATAPLTSTINFRAGQTRANNAVVTMGLGGDFTVRCVQSSGTTHFIVDVAGYFE